MSTASHTNNGRAPSRPALALEPDGPSLEAVVRQLQLPYAFVEVALRYLLLVLPAASSELACWRTRATAIPSTSLRHHALRALAKRGNIEGAALFATLAPRAQRRTAVRALVAFQTAYNYLDALSELPSDDPVSNADQLHQALLTALHPTAAHADYYACNPEREDGGFLVAVTEACRDALARLPSQHAVAPTARAAAARIVDFQALNLSDSQGGHGALRRWALETTPAGVGLAWWENAAAAGSSLAVHALIAAAAQPGVDPWDAREIERAYRPAIAALHSLLDSLVDRCEDHDAGRRGLLDHYESPFAAIASLAELARSAADACERLEQPHAHRVILTAMCSYYLSAPECDTDEGRAITRALTRVLGRSLSAAILAFRSRRLLLAVTRRAYT